MPYKSDRQRRYMHAAHPEIARQWGQEHGGKVIVKKKPMKKSVTKKPMKKPMKDDSYMSMPKKKPAQKGK